MKTTVIPASALVGNFQPGVSLHPTPTMAGVNTEGAHALAIPVPDGPSPMSETEHGPSTQKSQYQYPMWPTL